MKDGRYERFMRHSTTLVPIGVSGIGLLGLSIYRFLSPRKETETHKVIYDSAEVILSFGASFMVLLYMGRLLMSVLNQAFRGISFDGMAFTFVLFSLLGLLINPFALTVLRKLFPDKEQDPIAVSGVIASTLLTLYFTWAMYLGRKA